MPDVVKSCAKCTRKFILTVESRERARQGAKHLLYFCPSCEKVHTPAELAMAENSNQAPAATGAVVSSSPVASQQAMPVAAFPANYLSTGYYDAHGLSAWVFTEGARLAADVLSRNSPTSLRKKYDQLASAKRHLALHNDFAQVRPQLYRLRALTARDVNRQVVTKEFQEFMDRNLELAERDERNFRGFLEHFQSILAYARNRQGLAPAELMKKARLPEGYLAAGYFEESQGQSLRTTDTPVIRRDAIIDYPKQLAAQFIREGVKITSVRRFYTKLKAIEARLGASVPFVKCREGIYAFERDAVYAANREVVSWSFAAFIARNVALASVDLPAFNAFVEHFQSLVAFSTNSRE